MQPDTAIARAYFDTPARAERLQLLLHLVRNAGEVIYLRAPAGAGKSLFVHRLLDILGNDLAGVWLRGGVDGDVAAATIGQLGLAPDAALNWPDGVLAAIGEQELLIVVDDADDLALPAVERLATMHARGGRLLLIGCGGLAQTTRDWDVQFVDLPPFNVEQSSAFLRSNAGDEAQHINDDLAGFLHHSAHGRPGLLLQSLDEVLARARRQAEARHQVGGGRRWAWLGGAAAVVLVGAVLYFQDRINAVVTPPDEDAVATAPLAIERDIDEQAPAAAGPTTDVTAEAADEQAPLSRQPAKMPTIALPELSRLPSSGTVRTGMPDQTAGSHDDPPTQDDPLAAVMRDAMGVADGQAAAVAPERQSGPVDDEGGAAEAVNTDEARPVAPPAASGDTADRPSVADVARDLVAAATPRLDPTAEEPPAAAEDDAKPVVDPAATVREPAVPAVSAAPERPAASGTAPTRDEAGGPAPVEDRTRPADAAPRTPREPPTAVAPASVEKAVAGGRRWLASRDPGHFTLQLVGARERAAIEKFVRLHGVTMPYAIFERPLSGRPWYSLVAGEYPSRDAAVAARGRLPASLKRADIWPRTFASIQESL